MLGLPDRVTTCLFDLDGVLTDTASVHSAAWKEMFDDFLRARAPPPVRPLRAVRPGARLRAVRRRQAALGRCARLPRQPGHRPPGGDARTTRRTAATVQRAGQPQERGAAAPHPTGGVEVYEGSRRYLEAAERAGLRRAVVSSQRQHRGGAVGDRAGAAASRLRVDGVTIREQDLRGKPAPDTFLAGGAAARRRARREPPCSRTPSPGSRPAVPAGSATWSGSTGSGRPTSCARTAPTSSSRPRRAAGRRPVGPGGRRDDRCSGRTRSSRGACARPRSTSTCSPSRSRCSRSPTATSACAEPRRGRAVRHPGHLPQQLLRAPTAAVRGGGLRLPRGRADPRSTSPTASSIRLLVDDAPFDVRYGDLHEHDAQARPAAGILRALVDWTSPAGAGYGMRSPAAGVLHPAVGRGDRVRGARPVDTPAAHHRAVRARRQRGASRRCPPTPGSPRCWITRCTPVLQRPRRPLGRAAPPHHGQRAAAWARAWVTSSRRRAGRRPRSPRATDWARLTVACTLQPGEPLRLVKLLAYGWSSLRSHDRGARPGRRRARRRAASPAGTAWSQQQREYLDEFWDAADVEVDGDPELQQAVRFALFHVLQAGARAERRAIPAKGLTGPGLRRAHVLGHRDASCCRC